LTACELHASTVVATRLRAYIQGMRQVHRIDDRDTDAPPGDGRTRVVLANDHPGLRRRLLWLLDHADDLDVVGEATDFDATLHDVAVQHPHVLVLDLRMPDGFSAERIRRLRTASPGTEIVVTTMHASEVFATEALRAGAIGFVVADSADRELVEAVRRAARGLPYTSPRIRRAVA
jgi:two-component system, NarL family, response regulator NreC